MIDLSMIEMWKRYPILIVDDEPNVVAQLESELILEGFIVATAHSGEEGLEVFEQVEPKLVISDQKMDPGMSGTEFLAQIKARSPETVTMLLSAHCEREHLMDAVNKVNAQHYLLKPWREEELLLHVSQSLQLYHTQMERTRLANANRRLIDRMACMEGLSIVGDLSGALYQKLSPIIHTVIGDSADYVRALAGVEPAVTTETTEKFALANLGLVVTRLGELAILHRDQKLGGMQIRSVVDLLRQCVAEVHSSLSHVEVTEHYDKKVPHIWLHEGMFCVAVKALIENAIVFNAANSARLGMRLKHVRVDSEEVIRIDIEDNGPGVPPENRRKIFAPLFSTSCQEWDEPGQGFHSLGDYNFGPTQHTGLGLPIARWSIMQHDGMLECKDAQGNGALFRIEIPVHQEDLRRKLGVE